MSRPSTVSPMETQCVSILSGVRMLAETARGPGLPFIASVDTGDAEVAALRRALDRAARDPALAHARDVLSLRDFVVLSDADYEPLAALEREARELNYPAIA